jgi:two-component system chemotaxis response regulator CheY
VILSSLGAKGDIEECLRMGATSYLQKPIDTETMLRVLREAVA